MNDNIPIGNSACLPGEIALRFSNYPGDAGISHLVETLHGSIS